MQTNRKPVFTVTWQVRPGNEEVAADIITRFTPEAREEPGVELLMVTRSVTDPRHFLFYEVFSDQAAFDAHQRTQHFKKLIPQDALPLLASREWVQYAVV